MFSDDFMQAAAPANLDVGVVLGGAFGAIRRNWAPFLIYTLLLWVLPKLLVQAWSASTPGLSPGPLAIRTMLMSLPVSLLLTPLFQAVIAWTIWANEARTPAGLSAAFAAVGRRLVTILLASWLFQLAQVVGLVLLLVPGVMVLLAFQVVIPVCVAEQLPIEKAFQRALFLTRGQRWRLLLLWLALLAVSFGIGMIVGLATLMSGVGLTGAANPAMSVFRSAIGGLGGVFGAACVGSAYVELARIKGGGVGVEATAAVFA